MAEYKNYAVILAGGSGLRLKSDLPKQFVNVAGRSVLEHTYQNFDSHPLIDQIILVVPSDMRPEHDRIVHDIVANCNKPVAVVTGGATRNESTLNALRCIENGNDRVLIHDAARPLLSKSIITDCVYALKEWDAIDVVIECCDTIVEVTEAHTVAKIPDRARLRRGQTPQGFKVSVLREAYRRARLDGATSFSDDCRVVLEYTPEVSVHCVMGSEENIKITHPIDLVIADRLFQVGMLPGSTALAHSADFTFLRGKTGIIIGASSGIGEEIASICRDGGANIIGLGKTSTGFDVANSAQVGTILDKVYKEHGRIDFIVNSAGVLRRGDLTCMDDEAVLETVNVNFLGALYVAKHAQKYLAETKGHLILFTSSSFTRGRGSYAAYSASKAAVVNLMQALSEEWAAAGIHVNCINPERTDTPMRRAAFPDEDRRSLQKAFDVAYATVSVLGTDLTGQVIDVRRQLHSGTFRNGMREPFSYSSGFSSREAKALSTVKESSYVEYSKLDHCGVEKETT